MIDSRQIKAVAEALGRMPRHPLATLPTPLQEAPRLRAALGGESRCPRILIKRDDLTGLALGGNKARKLEFLVGDALAHGTTHLVTTGAGQSNHARMTAAAARIAGLGVTLVLTAGPRGRQIQGNLLLDHLLGAEILFIDPPDDPGAMAGPAEAETLARLEADLRARGERPYMIPLGGSTSVGALGYVAGAVEMAEQLAGVGERPSRLYFASSSRGTAAGLALGARLVGASYRVRGVAVAGGDPVATEDAVGIANGSAELLGSGERLAVADFETDQSQIGPGYGISTPGCLEAIRLLARTEGILLDPVYTAKGMAGLIADVRSGSIDPNETVIFLHTGGAPALFARAEELSSAIGRD